MSKFLKSLPKVHYQGQCYQEVVEPSGGGPTCGIHTHTSYTTESGSLLQSPWSGREKELSHPLSAGAALVEPELYLPVLKLDTVSSCSHKIGVRAWNAPWAHRGVQHYSHCPELSTVRFPQHSHSETVWTLKRKIWRKKKKLWDKSLIHDWSLWVMVP